MSKKANVTRIETRPDGRYLISVSGKATKIKSSAATKSNTSKSTSLKKVSTKPVVTSTSKSKNSTKGTRSNKSVIIDDTSSSSTNESTSNKSVIVDDSSSSDDSSVISSKRSDDSSVISSKRSDDSSVISSKRSDDSSVISSKRSDDSSVISSKRSDDSSVISSKRSSSKSDKNSNKGKSVIIDDSSSSSSDTEPIENTPEEYLTSVGYIPIEKVVVGSNDKYNAVYIKSLDPMGNTVLVQIDSSIKSSTSDKLLSVKYLGKEVKLKSIPYSVKNGTFDLFSPQVKGAAIDCADGVCIITSKKDGSVTENSYSVSLNEKDAKETSGVLTETFGEKALTEKKMLAIPIIDIEDIKHDKLASIQLVENVSGSIINEAFEQCRSIHSDFTDIANQITDIADYIDNLIYKTSAMGLDLHSEAMNYVVNPPEDTESNRKYTMLMNDIHSNNNDTANLVMICMELAPIIEQLRPISSKLSVIQDELDRIR